MKLDRLINTRFLGRPYRPTARRFEQERAWARQSAGPFAACMLDILPIRSMVDVGCGSGHWLQVFQQYGVERILGIDGAYTDRDRLQIDPACFIAHDLNQPIGPLGLGRFDLAMSVEVGEHLRPERAEGLVDDLCALSDVAMYGAAIKGQGGDQHVNEQWQSYWVSKFLRRGYLAYDVLRPAVWSNPEVTCWYKQNTILYVKRGSPAHVEIAARFSEPSTRMFDVVHPETYDHHLATKRGLRRLEKNIMRIVSQLTGIPRRTRQPLSGDEHIVDHQARY